MHHYQHSTPADCCQYATDPPWLLRRDLQSLSSIQGFRDVVDLSYKKKLAWRRHFALVSKPNQKPASPAHFSASPLSPFPSNNSLVTSDSRSVLIETLWLQPKANMKTLTLSATNCWRRSWISFSTALPCSSCFILRFWAFSWSRRSSSANLANICCLKACSSSCIVCRTAAFRANCSSYACRKSRRCLSLFSISACKGNVIKGSATEHTLGNSQLNVLKASQLQWHVQKLKEQRSITKMSEEAKGCKILPLHSLYYISSRSAIQSFHFLFTFCIWSV